MAELRALDAVTGSAAKDTAARLREEILAGTEPGTFLGSEDDLLTRLGVSRPTLRQAARILEHEDLLTVRRGKNGGLFARLPTSDTLAHVASVVLRAQGSTIEDLTRVNALIAAEAARLAAGQAPDADRRALADLVRDRVGGEPGDGRLVLDTALEVNRRLGALSGSPALALFASVLAELAHANFGVRLFAEPDRLASTRRYLLALTTAVASGEPAEAGHLVADHHERILRWLHQPSRQP